MTCKTRLESLHRKRRWLPWWFPRNRYRAVVWLPEELVEETAQFALDHGALGVVADNGEQPLRAWGGVTLT